MIFKNRLIILLLLLSLTCLQLVAQESLSLENAEGNELLSFMFGEWAVESQRNEEAYLTQQFAPDSEWQTSYGVSKISSLMEDMAIIERYISVNDESVYEQTVFLGTRSDGSQWDVAITDNVINQLFYLRGNYQGDGNILQLDDDNRRAVTRWQVQIEFIEVDSFEWRLYLISGAEQELIWRKHYMPLSSDTSFGEEAETIRNTYSSPPAPEEMSDFHFWLGFWQVDHDRFDDVVDRIELASGGHAMIEFWEVQNMDNPAQFFTMTIWDEELGGYHNWLWGRVGRTQVFKGGTCQGEGEYKECRLAGRFYNITDESIDWTYGSSNWVFNRLEYP